MSANHRVSRLWTKGLEEGLWMVGYLKLLGISVVSVTFFLWSGKAYLRWDEYLMIVL